jgi:hypothetical protein
MSSITLEVNKEWATLRPLVKLKAKHYASAFA